MLADGKTNNVIGTITVGSSPNSDKVEANPPYHTDIDTATALSVNPSTNIAYVVNVGDNT